MKRGRKKTKASGRMFKLCRPADRAVDDLANRFGWTATATVERALLFASTHPDFSMSYLQSKAEVAK